MVNSKWNLKKEKKKRKKKKEKKERKKRVPLQEPVIVPQSPFEPDKVHFLEIVPE